MKTNLRMRVLDDIESTRAHFQKCVTDDWLLHDALERQPNYRAFWRASMARTSLVEHLLFVEHELLETLEQCRAEKPAKTGDAYLEYSSMMADVDGTRDAWGEAKPAHEAFREWLGENVSRNVG